MCPHLPPVVVRSIYKKICRYRRTLALPCYFVQVVNTAEGDTSDFGELEAIKDSIGSEDPAVEYLQANPFSGRGVMPLFDGLVHTVVAAEPKVRCFHTRTSSFLFWLECGIVWYSTCASDPVSLPRS